MAMFEPTDNEQTYYDPETGERYTRSQIQAIRDSGGGVGQDMYGGAQPGNSYQAGLDALAASKIQGMQGATMPAFAATIQARNSRPMVPDFMQFRGGGAVGKFTMPDAGDMNLPFGQFRDAYEKLSAGPGSRYTGGGGFNERRVSDPRFNIQLGEQLDQLRNANPETMSAGDYNSYVGNQIRGSLKGQGIQSGGNEAIDRIRQDLQERENFRLRAGGAARNAASKLMGDLSGGRPGSSPAGGTNWDEMARQYLGAMNQSAPVAPPDFRLNQSQPKTLGFADMFKHSAALPSFSGGNATGTTAAGPGQAPPQRRPTTREDAMQGWANQMRPRGYYKQNWR